MGSSIVVGYHFLLSLWDRRLLVAIMFDSCGYTYTASGYACIITWRDAVVYPTQTKAFILLVYWLQIACLCLFAPRLWREIRVVTVYDQLWLVRESLPPFMIYRENLNMTFHVGRNREIEFPPQDAGLDRISTGCNKQTEGGVIEKGNGPTMKFPPYSEKLTGFGRLKKSRFPG